MDNQNTVWSLLDELSKKKGITEVIINAHDLVYIEREGELVRLNTDLTQEDLTGFAQEVAQLNHGHFSDETPIVDGTLPDGSRVNIISSAYTGNRSPAITIRKYLKEIHDFDHLDGKFKITDKWIRFFKALIASKANIIVSGGTGVGKTTFLNLLLQEISPLERVITIEDTKELNFKSANSVRLLSATASSLLENKLDMRALLKNTLRMRPDRIIVGEVRSGEVFDLLQAMNTGHQGSMCTIHANSPGEALIRLETLFLFAGFDVPLKAVRNQIQTAIDYIIQLDRDRDGQRVISKVTEISNMEGDQILMQDIGIRGENGPEFTGLVPRGVKELMDYGLNSDFFVDI